MSSSFDGLFSSVLLVDKTTMKGRGWSRRNASGTVEGNKIGSHLLVLTRAALGKGVDYNGGTSAGFAKPLSSDYGEPRRVDLLLRRRQRHGQDHGS